ncbi:MAG: PorT family protein [Bacteroidetes bacterium]|nr:PorT family protein [Bacteroidota bacterium]
MNIGRSQNTNQNIFTLVPALGINACQIHGDNLTGYNKPGLFVGTNVQAMLSNKLSVSLGFYFSQKGAWKNQNPDKGDYTYYHLNLNYFDMPLMFNYFFYKRFYLSIGPSVAYLINYSESNEFGDWTGRWPFQKFEYAINSGMGMKLKNNFTVEVRFNNSVLPIRPYGIAATGIYYPNPVARFFNKGLYSNIVSIFVSYTIPLTKTHAN